MTELAASIRREVRPTKLRIVWLAEIEPWLPLGALGSNRENARKSGARVSFFGLGGDRGSFRHFQSFADEEILIDGVAHSQRTRSSVMLKF